MLFQFYFKVLVLGEKMRLNQPKTQPLVEIEVPDGTKTSRIWSD